MNVATLQLLHEQLEVKKSQELLIWSDLEKNIAQHEKNIQTIEDKNAYYAVDRLKAKNIVALQVSYQYQQSLENQLKELKEQLETLQIQSKEKMAQIVQMNVKMKIYEKLMDKEIKQKERRVQKQEQNEIDDFVAMRYYLKKEEDSE